MAGKTARDVGTLIRKAGEFAAGAGFFGDTAQSISTGGQANAGTSSKIGGKLKGGALAISPALRDLQSTVDKSALTSAQINKLNADAQATRAEQEALQTPFDLQSLVGGADPTGTLFPKIQKIFDANSVDMDGNGITTQAEVTEAIEDGRLNMQEISDAIGESVSTLKNNVIDINSLDIDQKLAAINVRGGGTITREMFKQNPTLAASNKPLAMLIQEEARAKEQLKTLVGTQAGIAKDIKQREADRPIAQQKAKIINSKQFNTIVGNAAEAILRTRGDEKTIQAIINETAAQFPRIVGGEIRATLGQVSRREEVPSIEG